MIDTQAMGVNNDQYLKNLNHTVRHSNGAQKFELKDQGPMSTKNQTRADILEKLKEAVVPKSATKKKEQDESEVAVPENSQQRGSGRSLLSGELDNTSEKSASQLDKSSEIPAPSVAASGTMK